MKKYNKLAVVVCCLTMLFSTIAFHHVHALSADEDAIYNTLINTYGFSTAQASGIMANIQEESSFVATSDDGVSYGLFQWTGNRKQGLYDYARANGMDYTTSTAQLAYMYYELQNDENGVYNKLIACENSADGAYQAAYDFCYSYERPKNKVIRAKHRGETARDYYFANYASTFNNEGRIVPAVLDADQDLNSSKPTVKRKKRYTKGFYKLKLTMSVRDRASTNARVIGTLKKGRRIKVKSVRNRKWGKITYLGKSSYISLRYAKKL